MVLTKKSMGFKLKSQKRKTDKRKAAVHTILYVPYHDRDSIMAAQERIRGCFLDDNSSTARLGDC